MDPVVWFEYMDQFDEHCIKPVQYETCSVNVMKDLKIQLNTVEKCV